MEENTITNEQQDNYNMENSEEFEFQAEIKQLLNILVYSLYTQREIFLRELISNATDALDKFRFLQLGENQVSQQDGELAIKISYDKDNKSIIVADNGIGMTKKELVDNIGTIARSGSMEFFKKLAEDSRQDINIIGQFGVGFYSVFMVAKEVIIKTNSYQNDQPGWMWISDGSGKFKISPLENFKQGTEIKLMLKDDAVEFADKTRIEEVIKKYSNFVPYPIKLEEEKVNTISAIWTQTPSSVKEEEYREFYKFMANSVEDPFFWVHKAADVPLQIYSILYVPKTSMENFGFGKVNRGLSLYARKVMIMSECKDLLPEYLRFVNGVVDSEDISLNISRETVQDNLVLQKIKRNLVKWIIDRISLVAAKEEENYHLFWQQFGRFIKEGIVADFDNRNKLAALLRFNTSLAKDQDETISLAKYLERMKEGQDEIYYMGGPNREEALASPLMEIFKEKGVEVLFLYDPMDEVLITHLKEFEGKQFKSVELGDLNLKALGVEEKTDKQEKPVLQQSKIDKILELFKELLKDQVSDVRESQRLTGSPCILVSPDDAVSSHVQKLMRQVNKDFPLSKRVLEINSDNKLISKLADLHYAGEKEEYVRNACLQLFDNLLVLEGMLQNPRQMVERVNYLMQESLGEEKSPIILT